MKELHLSDVTAIIDTREQTPFNLEPMRVEAGTLAVGDYSVAGLESVVSIERKSLPDFVACCGRERDRFQRELDRLRGWPVSAVVLEFGWQALEQGNWRSIGIWRRQIFRKWMNGVTRWTFTHCGIRSEPCFRHPALNRGSRKRRCGILRLI